MISVKIYNKSNLVFIHSDKIHLTFKHFMVLLSYLILNTYIDLFSDIFFSYFPRCNSKIGFTKFIEMCR